MKTMQNHFVELCQNDLYQVEGGVPVWVVVEGVDIGLQIVTGKGLWSYVHDGLVWAYPKLVQLDAALEGHADPDP